MEIGRTRQIRLVLADELKVDTHVFGQNVHVKVETLQLGRLLAQIRARLFQALVGTLQLHGQLFD